MVRHFYCLGIYPVHDSLSTGISSLLLGVQQPPIPKGRTATSYHGLCMSYLSKRRRDCRQRPSVSERPLECHQVSSFLDRLNVLGISVREQAGVTTDLGQDPTLVSALCGPFPVSPHFFDPRHTLTLLAQTAAMRSKLSYFLVEKFSRFPCRCSARSSTKINQRERRHE